MIGNKYNTFSDFKRRRSVIIAYKTYYYVLHTTMFFIYLCIVK